MKGTCIVLGLVLAGAPLSAAWADNALPTNFTKNKLTGLPVYPGMTETGPLPRTVLCKSQMSGDFYIVQGKITKDLTKWYTGALPGFKKFSSVVGETSQDTYFSADGTQEVAITGVRNSPEAYSISYGRFQPGLPAIAMATFNSGKMICNHT
jgi:hypothetical protein